MKTRNYKNIFDNLFTSFGTGSFGAWMVVISCTYYSSKSILGALIFLIGACLFTFGAMTFFAPLPFKLRLLPFYLWLWAKKFYNAWLDRLDCE